MKSKEELADKIESSLTMLDSLQVLYRFLFSTFYQRDVSKMAKCPNCLLPSDGPAQSIIVQQLKDAIPDSFMTLTKYAVVEEKLSCSRTSYLFGIAFW